MGTICWLTSMSGITSPPDMAHKCNCFKSSLHELVWSVLSEKGKIPKPLRCPNVYPHSKVGPSTVLIPWLRFSIKPETVPRLKIKAMSHLLTQLSNVRLNPAQYTDTHARTHTSDCIECLSASDFPSNRVKVIFLWLVITRYWLRAKAFEAAWRMSR